MRSIAILILLLCPVLPAQTLDELMAQAAKADFDKGREALMALSDMIAKAHGSPIQMRDIEKRFIALLQSDATLAGKDFACKQLSVMGSEAAVPALAGMLLEPKTAEMARYALQRIPGPAVDQVLREALSRTSGKTRPGIINTLGVRRDTGAVAALGPLTSSQDPETAAAALFALAEIADPAAIQVLAEARGPNAAEAYLKAADRLAAGGNAAAALPIYKKLYAAGEPVIIRMGALHGLAAAGGAQSTPVLMEALHASDAGLQATAIGALAKNSAKQLVAEMPKLSEAAQVRILGTLAEKGDTSVLPAFLTALKGSSKPVRLGAIEGLGLVGNASVVPVLAGIAAGGDQAEQTAARASLGRIPGKSVDQAVVDGIAGAEPKVKLELIRAAGERGTGAAAPVLLKTARDANTEVRRESLRALRDTGSAGDISGLVALVVSPVEAGDRSEAVRSLGAVLRRSDSSRIKDVVSAFGPASDTEARTALMQVLGQSGNAEALRLIRAALNDPNADSRRAAILALGDWPDGTPISDLFEIARNAANPTHQVLALRGALRLIGQPGSRRTPRESVKLLAEAMGLAKQADEKRAVLALLPRFPGKDALELARGLVNDSEVGAEAKAAVARLERGRR